jgi:hypothetical protein
MDIKIQNRKYVIPADKFTWSKFERTANSIQLNLVPLSRTVVRKIHVMPAEAGIQRLKSLDYSIHPCMLPLLHPSMGYALQAILRLFKFDPVKFVGPAFGCSLKLMDSILNITLSMMARRVSHRDVTNKSAPGRFSPAKIIPG